VIGFGAHDGRLPLAQLQPDPALRGGPLRLLPFVLLGDDDAVQRIAHAMEEALLQTGMAGAATALCAQHGFGGRLEHARYLSLHDLCAMTAMQYEHAGLGALWPLLEAALLAPDADEWLDAAPEPLLRYVGGEVRIARMDLDSWRDAGLAPAALAPDRLARAHAAFEGRVRQFGAVLGAHAIPTRMIDVMPGRDPRAALR
jgi:hypothetical protein